MKLHLLLALCAAMNMSTLAQAQGQRFPIHSFQVVGNTLLPQAEITRLLSAYTGAQRDFGDVQLALEALEAAYRNMGYTAVAVLLPEQDISQGKVQFQVVEARLDEVNVSGQQHFELTNVRRSLPSLVSGAQPNTRLLAQELGLVNENPAKKVEVVLMVSDKPGMVNALIRVQDKPVQRWVLSLDNTGRGTTQGDYRVGVLWQHANLFDRDHVLTAQYTTSPSQPQDVTQINLAYKVPLYRWGHSVELFGGYSNVDAGALGAGIDGFTGQGRVFGLKYNQRLVRRGEVEHTLRYGLDWRQFSNVCAGLACPLLGRDVTAVPWSVMYQGQHSGVRQMSLWALAYVRNTGWGADNRAANYAQATHRPGTTGTDPDYSVLRLNASHIRQLAGGTQARVNVAAQYTSSALIAAEQMGLAGAQLVRGYTEREVARDKGYVVNLEFYTPELSPLLGNPAQSVRGLVFLDHASGSYTRKPGEANNGRQTINSVGFGLRIAHKERYSLRLDLAQALNSAASTQKQQWAAHLSLTASF